MSDEREPTEAEWAAVGRYMLVRLELDRVVTPGVNQYQFEGGWPWLIGPNAVSAVMRAIVAEDDELRRMEAMQ